MLEQDIKKIMISHDEIVVAARELGQKLTVDYQGKNPILVGILKGSVPFIAELILILILSLILCWFLAIMGERLAQVSSMLLTTIGNYGVEFVFTSSKILLIPEKPLRV